MAICVECRFYFENSIGWSDCSNDDVPITDFVLGTRSCYELNSEGDCKGFKPKDDPESIYEQKSDEDLANTS